MWISVSPVSLWLMLSSSSPGLAGEIFSVQLMSWFLSNIGWGVPGYMLGCSWSLIPENLQCLGMYWDSNIGSKSGCGWRFLKSVFGIIHTWDGFTRFKTQICSKLKLTKFKPPHFFPEKMVLQRRRQKKRWFWGVLVFLSSKILKKTWWVLRCWDAHDT